MCGIFGFALTKPIPTDMVLRVLEKLEVHQYPNEEKPVGGYGAGIAILNNDRSITLEKLGKTADSPVKTLSGMLKTKEASVLIAHVRMPSPQFMETAKFRETAQPYIAKCRTGMTVVSAHNGYVENFEDIHRQLGEGHSLESATLGLVDSEIIPHYFEEMLLEKANPHEALSHLSAGLNGSNTACLLQLGNTEAFLHLIHAGKTRGLTIWTNERNETVFCSRRETLTPEFSDLLDKGTFTEKVSVQWQEQATVTFSLPIRT